MSYSNYEQVVVINDHKLLGVQNVDGSYGLTEKAIKVAGLGFVDAFPNSSLQGNFNITRKMIGSDPIYQYRKGAIDGAILYENNSKGFGFSNARISRYSVTCSVGEVPDIQTNLIVFGDLGADISSVAASQDDAIVSFPDQSSIKLNISDLSTDAVVDFSYSQSINWTPIYSLPKNVSQIWEDDLSIENLSLDPVQIDIQYPIETDITLTIVAQEYEIEAMKNKLKNLPRSTLSIQICDAQDHTNVINSFEASNARIISESVSSSIDQQMSLSLTYKSYETHHNTI